MSPSDSPCADGKRLLRRQAAERRRAAHAAAGAAAGERAAVVFCAALAGWLAEGPVVSAYWPLGEEMDPRPLLRELAARGCPTALPVVTGRALPLAFRRWSPGEPLEAGPHGTRHPPDIASVVEPRLVVVPLLAFDRRGGRLGYGGGYYDRTLAALRAEARLLGRPVAAVGLAYAAQAVDRVPTDGHDQDLDWIVTEEGAMEADR